MAEGVMVTKHDPGLAGAMNNPGTQVMALPDGGEIALSMGLIRKYCIRGRSDIVTDQEAMMALTLCRARKLNPFTGEVYFIKYGERDPMQTVTAKDTILARAAMNPGYRGFRAGIVAMFEATGEVQRAEGAIVPPGFVLLGGWCEVYMDGRTHPVRAEVSLDEYQGRKRDGNVTSMWRLPEKGGKAATMIRKVAICQAHREAEPEALGRMYDRDELPTTPIQAGPGRPFEVEAVTTPTQPAPSLPAAPPEEPEPVPEPEPTPEPQIETRSRRNRFSMPDGREVATAGISGETLVRIHDARDSHPLGAEIVHEYLAGLPIRHRDLTYMREDEGEELLARLAESAAGETESDGLAPETQDDHAPTFAVGEIVQSREGSKPVVADACVVEVLPPRSSGRDMVVIETNGVESRWYADQLERVQDVAPATNDARGDGWVACNGPHPGKQVSTVAVCGKCDEAGACPELAAHRRQAASALI